MNCGHCLHWIPFNAEAFNLGKCPVKNTNTVRSDRPCEHFINEELLQLFWDHFIIRSDCYAQQTMKGYVRVDQPLTNNVLHRHFQGATIGAYQLNILDNTKYLCFDIDPEKNGNPKEVTRRLIDECTKKPSEEEPRFYESNVVLEASRYPDSSYHIWILFNPPIKAKIARFLGRKILEDANLSPRKIEVFPKQEKLGESLSFGNFVKLPLGLHKVENKWSSFLDLTSMEPVTADILKEKHGCNFSRKDLSKLMKLTEKPSLSTQARLTKKRRTSYTKGIRPCLIRASKLNALPHEMRLAITFEYLAKKATIDEICNLFREQTDFDENKTRYQIEHAVEKGYKPFTCIKIRELGFCLGSGCKLYRKQKTHFEKLVAKL